MKLFGISNSKSFYEKILCCAGNVYREDGNGNRQDMKALAEYLIHAGVLDTMGPIPEIALSIDDPSDVVRMMNYALQIRHPDPAKS